MLRSTIFAAVILVGGCTATTRLATRRCPPPTTAVLLDFVTGMTLIAVASLREYNGNPYLVPASMGTAFMGSAYATELSCAKRR